LVPKTKLCPVNIPAALTIVMWKWWVHSNALQLCKLLHVFIVISVMKIQSKITTNSINTFTNLHISST
jgi:hypothetical protein